jgi:hypothetical protein
MTRCSLKGGYQRIGELTASIFSNLKYTSTTTQHTTWNPSIYLLPNFLPRSTFRMHIYSKPLNLTTLLFFPCIFLSVTHSRCSLEFIYLLIPSSNTPIPFYSVTRYLSQCSLLFLEGGTSPLSYKIQINVETFICIPCH